MSRRSVEEVAYIEMMMREARLAERERCAKIADDRARLDHEKWKDERDWRMPYAFNRVVRASMDIAVAIRKES